MARPISTRSYLDALTRRYNNDLQAKGLVVPDRQMSAPVQPAPQSSQGPDMASILSQIAGPDESFETGQSFLEKITDPSKPVGKVIDVLSQPAYAMGQNVGEIASGFKENGIAEELKQRFLTPGRTIENLKDLSGVSYYENFGSRNGKRTVSDIVGRDTEFVNRKGEVTSLGNDGLTFGEDDGALEKAGKFAIGLGLDIATDPSTYIGPGTVKTVATAPIKAARAIQTVAKEGSAISRGAGAVEKALAATGEKASSIVKPGVRKTRRAALPDAVDENADIAARLAPVKQDEVADLLRRFSDEADADSIVIRAAEDGAENLADAGRVVTEAASDADKMASGTFVPKVNTTTARRIGDVEASGPKEAVLRATTPRGRTKPYSEALATLMRKTDDEASDLMYPGLADAKITSPYREVGAKRAAESKTVAAVKGEAPAPVNVTPEVSAAISDVVSKEEILQAISQQRPGAGTMGLAFTSHFALANAKDARAAEKVFQSLPYKERTALTPHGVAPEFAENAEALISRSQAVLDKIGERVGAARRPQATLQEAQNGASKGRAAAEAASVGPEAPISSATVEKIAKTSEKTAVAASSVRRAPRFRKLTGAALNSWKRSMVLKHGINPVHVEELLSMKTPGGFASRLEKMKAWRTDGPAYEVMEKVLKPTPLPEDDILAAVKEGVETANEQIIAGKAGNLSAADFAEASTADLSRETFEAIRDALGSGVGKQQWTDIDSSLKFRTDIQGTLRNSEKYGEGIGINRNSVNVKAQMNIGQRLLRNGIDAANAAKMPKAGRADFIRKTVMQGLDESDMFFRSMGIQPVVTRTTSGWPLSLGDLLRIISSDDKGRRFLNGRVFDGFGERITWNGSGKSAPAGTIKLDSLLESARPVLDTLFEEFPDLAKVEDLTATIKRIGKVGINVKTERELVATATMNEMNTLIPDGVNAAGKTKYKVAPVAKESAEEIASELASTLLRPQMLRSLFQTVHNNTAAAGIVFGQKVNEITEEAISRVANALADPYMGTKTLIDEISVPTAARVSESAKDAGILADSAVLDTAGRSYEEALTEALTTGDRINAEYIVKITNAVKAGESRQAIEHMYGQYKHAVSEGFHAETISRLMQSGDNAAIAMNSGISRILQPLAARFLHHWDNPTLHRALLSQGNLGRVVQGAIRKDLNAVKAAHSSDAIREGLKLVQAGVPYQSMTGEAGDAARAMANNIDLIFRADAAGTNGMYSQFVANGFDVDHIIDKMGRGRIQLPESMRFDKAKAMEDAARNGTTMPEELGKQWTKWDIDDPIDFLGRMSSILGSLTTDASTAFEGLRIAQSMNLAATTKRAGFVRYAGDTDSVMAKYLPRGTWLDPDIADEFKKIDEILTQSAKTNDFVENTLGVVIQKWKSGMTIWHLGHHIRNAVGDGVMSYLVNGVSSPKYYARATRILAPGKSIRGTYDAWDGLRALQGQSTAMEGGKFAARVRLFGGQKIDVSDLELQQAMMERGVLPDFATQEDIINYADTAGKGAGFAKAVNGFKPLGGKGQKIAGGISEARDDYFRVAAFMSILEKPPTKAKWNSIQDAFDYAAERIRKAHPDGSDLTNFERKMRMVFPFYSWTRKAIPLVLEATLMHPGRVMQYPKAMYNWAQSNGMDLESMSVPFPPRELFPDFLTDQMTGPLFRTGAGHAIGMDFGFPQADLANDFLSDPVTGVAGMLNPLIKMPIELGTGSRIGQRSKIADDGEYIDSNIPMVSQTAQLLGYSPTNSLLNLSPTRQTAVTKGNKSAVGEGDGLFGLDSEALLNRTLNMRYTDYQKPSYVRLGQIQERDRKAKEKESN